jgi:hypothetical protein
MFIAKFRTEGVPLPNRVAFPGGSKCVLSSIIRPIAAMLSIALVSLMTGCSTSRADQLPKVPEIAFIRDSYQGQYVYVRTTTGRINPVASGGGVTWSVGHKFLLIKVVNDNLNPPEADLFLFSPTGLAGKRLTHLWPGQVRFFQAGVYHHKEFVAYDTLNPGINLISLNGAEEALLAPRVVVDDFSISNNGAQIAFITDSQERVLPQGLYVIARTGRPKLLLADTSFRAVNCPAWSPTGQWIAFTMSISKGYDTQPASSTWLIRPTGRDLHRIRTGSCPMWFPGGKWLGYFGQSGFLFAIRPDGRDRTKLARLAGNFDQDFMDDQPTW